MMFDDEQEFLEPEEEESLSEIEVPAEDRVSIYRDLNRGIQTRELSANDVQQW